MTVPMRTTKLPHMVSPRSACSFMPSHDLMTLSSPPFYLVFFLWTISAWPRNIPFVQASVIMGLFHLPTSHLCIIISPHGGRRELIAWSVGDDRCRRLLRPFHHTSYPVSHALPPTCIAYLVDLTLVLHCTDWK